MPKATLVQMLQHQLDGKRKELVHLQTQEAELLTTLTQLELEISHELQHNQVDSLHTLTLPAYLERSRQRKLHINTSLTKLRSNIEKAHTEIQSTFAELKKYDILLEREQKAHQKALKTTENQQLDETAIQQFIRKESHP